MCYPRLGIGGSDSISYGVERYRQPFLALAQGEVRLLQQIVLHCLNIEQVSLYSCVKGVPEAE